MKKTIKIFGIGATVLLVLLAAAPAVYGDPIEKIMGDPNGPIEPHGVHRLLTLYDLIEYLESLTPDQIHDVIDDMLDDPNMGQIMRDIYYNIPDPEQFIAELEDLSEDDLRGIIENMDLDELIAYIENILLEISRDKDGDNGGSKKLSGNSLTSELIKLRDVVFLNDGKDPPLDRDPAEDWWHTLGNILVIILIAILAIIAVVIGIFSTVAGAIVGIVAILIGAIIEILEELGIDVGDLLMLLAYCFMLSLLAFLINFLNLAYDVWYALINQYLAFLAWLIDYWRDFWRWLLNNYLKDPHPGGLDAENPALYWPKWM